MIRALLLAAAILVTGCTPATPAPVAPPPEDSMVLIEQKVKGEQNAKKKLSEAMNVSKRNKWPVVVVRSRLVGCPYCDHLKQDLRAFKPLKNTVVVIVYNDVLGRRDRTVPSIHLFDKNHQFLKTYTGYAKSKRDEIFSEWQRIFQR